MPTTEKPTAATRETWNDWIRAADPAFDESSIVYDRIEDVIASANASIDHRFQRDDFHVDAVTIRYWQREGLLPYPIRRWHEGATRSLYPRNVAWEAIVQIRQLQDAGYSLDQITSHLRGWLSEFFNPGVAEMEEQLQAVIQRREDFFNRRIRKVTVTFEDEEGWKASYTIERM